MKIGKTVSNRFQYFLRFVGGKQFIKSTLIVFVISVDFTKILSIFV